MGPASFRHLCKALAYVILGMGALGTLMNLSLCLSSGSMSKTAVLAFIPGSILLGTGVLSLSILAATEPRPLDLPPPRDEIEYWVPKRDR
jgi:hypothetical protein